METTGTLTSEITAILAADEWKPRWAACKNAMTDAYGNTVSIHEMYDGEVKIEFTYALPGSSIEIMHLDPSRGARRIALAIIALAAPEE